MSLVTLLVVILVAILIVWLLFWLIDSTGIPSPMNVVAKVIVAIVAVLIVLERSGYAGRLLG